jgi:hypothetical protein
MATETTDILSLPYIMPSQAQKHVTHNEAIAALDVLVQAAVAGEAAAAPDTPAPGDRLIVARDATGAFAGKDDAIAVWRDGGWTFMAPRAGWTAYDRTRRRAVAFTGEGWEELPPPPALADLETVGINAAADAGNRLAVASAASLFSHEGTDHRLKVNKAAETDTASLLFQDGYSGRAEMGLAGSDDFVVKVSPDGTNWAEAMRIDRNSGRVGFPAGGVRETLFAPRTYHVDPAGDDGDDGLSSGSAFATVRKAVAAASAIDSSIYQTTIQLAAGHYAETVDLGRTAGALPVLINGAGPALSTVDRITASNNGSLWRLRNMGLAGSTGGIAMQVIGHAAISIGLFDFGGTSRSQHARVESSAVLKAEGNFSVSAGAAQQAFDAIHADIAFQGRTIAITADIGVGTFFAARGAGYLQLWASTFSTGSFTVTGRRYACTSNGILETGGVADLIPGTAAGSTATGGQYI